MSITTKPTAAGQARHSAVPSGFSDPDPQSLPATESPGAPLRIFGLSFIAFFVIFAAWAIATPPFSSPDEPYHVSRAASVVRGEIRPKANDTFGGGAGVVIEPIGIGQAAVSYRCFEHHPHRTAACAKPTPSNSNEIAVFSGAALYAPVYYGVVGWPSLWMFNAHAVIAMRLISAAWCAALLAVALTIAIRSGRSRWLSLGVVVAVTPQVAFLAGTVNPNSVEICGGVLAWTAGLAIVTAKGKARTSTLAAFALGATSMVLMRTLSPLWLLGIIAACLILGGPEGMGRLRGQRRVYGYLIPPLVGSFLQLLWVFMMGTANVPAGAKTGTPTGFTLPAVIDMQPYRWLQYFGDMGWLDIRIPAVLAVIWGAIWIAMAIYAMRRTTVFGRWALGLVILGVLVLPVMLEWPLTHRLGYFWQGRYSLPIVLGVPLLAAACMTLAPRVQTVSRRWFWVIGGVCTAIGLWALTRVFMRYSSGFFHYSIFGSWQAPIPFLIIAAAFIAAMTLLCWLSTTTQPTNTRSVQQRETP